MIGIIDYGAGNMRSVRNALKRLGVHCFISNDAEELKTATKLILPGVGEARTAMESLNRTGLMEWLRNVRVPFLGICLGMQLLFEESAERRTTCLGIVSGKIVPFNPAQLNVPHMGWNQVTMQTSNPLFAGVPQNAFFYFAHSYYAPHLPETIGVTEYGIPFSSAVQKDNFYGVQFHPEKSGEVGLQLLHNFVERC